MHDSLDVDKFAGRSRMTRSGRVFSPQSAQDNVDALAKSKGKQVVVDNHRPVYNTLAQTPSSDMAKNVEKIMRYIRQK